jgi:hypothetical protein
MLAGGEPRRDPGADNTTLDSIADARGVDVDVALRFRSGRVTTVAAVVETLVGDSGCGVEFLERRRGLRCCDSEWEWEW